ncbi:MAG: TonB-dependent receptor [Gammaproteobacteria bacterium]
MSISRSLKNPAAFLFLSTTILATDAAAQLLEEVVVTAQRRAENVQNVPISISTFSGDFIEESGIDTLQDLGQYTPNLTLSHSSQVANHRIIMRGVGSVGNNAIEPSVAVFIDGVYYPRPASVVGSLTDVEMVEVLRGPQGTLFGRNASMGALNIRTKNPTRDFQGEIRGTIGNYGQHRVSGNVSNALTENTAGHFSFNYSDRGGYGDNAFTSGNSRGEVGSWEEGSARGKLHFTPSNNVDIMLGADYSRVDNQGGVIEVKSDTVLPQYLTTLGLVLDPNAVPGTVPPGFLGIGPVPDTTDTFDYNINQDHQDSGKDEQWGINLHVDWGIGGDHTIRSISSYRDWQNDTFESALRLPGDLLNRVTRYETESFSQELQLLSPEGGRFEYVAGLYYYDESYKIDQNFDLGTDFCQAAANAAFLQAFGGGAGVPTALGAAGLTSGACLSGAQTGAIEAEFQQDVTSIAVYGQFTVNLTDDLRFTGGLRWTNDDKEGSFSQSVNNLAVSPAVLNLRIPEAAPNLSFDDDELTWMVNLSYDVTEDVMAFATYSTGYKSGGFNSEGGNRLFPRTFASETVDNYEVGMKSRLLDNRLIANVTLFRTEIDDYQDRQFDGVNFIVQNAGELTQQGVELDIIARPVDRLTSVIGVSYLDSEFDHFPDATNLPAVVAFFQSQGLTPPPRDLTGERNHFSPKWQLSMMAEWSDHLPGTDLGWFLRGEYQYVSKQNVGAETNQNPQSIQPGYDLVNARAGLRGANDNWEVAAFVRNLTDENYCQTIFNQPIGTTLGLVDATTGGGMQRCVLGAPRTFGMEAVYRF